MLTWPGRAHHDGCEADALSPDGHDAALRWCDLSRGGCGALLGKPTVVPIVTDPEPFGHKIRKVSQEL